MRGDPRGAALLLLAVLAGWPVAAAGTADRLRGSEGLSRAYDRMLDARFEQAAADLRVACGPAPPEACEVLRAASIWWRILLDPASPSLDADFSQAVEDAIRDTEAWTARSPEDAEAWFYQGGAYAARVQFRVLRGQRLGAARDGKRIKTSLERALKIDPELNDAYFGIGLYQYYADVAPTAAKILRWLLLLPGGDRQKGLERMLRAQDHGELLQGEADYQLHLIYLWYEKRPEKALALLQSLQKRYPHSPLFPSLTAEVHQTYFHDLTASMADYQGLFAAARAHRVEFPELAETTARLGLARTLDALFQTDRAIDHFQAVLDREPAAPYGAMAQAALGLGRAYDRLGQREEATAAYRRALQEAPAKGFADLREDAENGLRRRPDQRTAEAFRLSLEGWRLFERGALHEAAVALRRAIDLKNTEPVAHYRYGRVLLASHDEAGALREFERAIQNGRAAPGPLLATTYLEAARVHDRSGRSEQAADLYRAAAAVFGGGEDTRAAATRALSRLRTRHPRAIAR